MNPASTLPAIFAGSRVRIEKGCQARSVSRGTTAEVVSVTALGADYSHQVKVVLQFFTGPRVGQFRRLAFYARHPNRLSDVVVGMNDGNPCHRIEVRRA